jgi:hypothetical protein
MELFAQTVASIALIMLLIIITQTEASGQVRRRDEPPHPLSKVALHRSRKLLDSSVTISASPDLLGQNVAAPFSSSSLPVPCMLLLSWVFIMVLVKMHFPNIPWSEFFSIP